MNQKLDFVTKELIDKAVLEIDKNGIPSGRDGTKYAVVINGKNYPFKLLITEAAKLVGISLNPSDFSSNAHYRTNLQEITNYPVINLKNTITFKDLKDLVELINRDLGDFCSQFQYKRKELLNMGSATNRDKLFIISKDDRDWVINPGGGTELQYHLYLRNNEVGYGLGFNTQYVPFANKKTPVEYIKPYADSFLSKSEYYNNLRSKGFDYLIGDESQLKNLVYDNYVLIGKKTDAVNKNGDYEISDAFYQEMIKNIQEILFQTYSDVVGNIKNIDTMLKETSEFESLIKLLKQKKQIILQGPPGTGKTYTAKKIAEQIAGRRSVASYNALTPEMIVENLEVGQKIANASGKQDYYTINAINEDTIELQSERSQPWKPKYVKIIYKYNQLLAGETPSNINSKEPYELAVAKHLFDTIKPATVKTENNYTLVQFHPSYSYEDFVRGITVKNQDNTIVYKTEDKILAELSRLASQKNDIEDYNLPLEYSRYLIDKTLEKEKTGKTYYFNKEKTIRLLDVHKSNNEIGRLRYETLADNGEWYMQTWVNIENNYNIESWKNSEHHKLSHYNKIEHYEIWKDFDVFVKKLQNNDYVLIIDEINRANLPSVLGELIYALEYRGEAVETMYAIDGDAKITIPENLYIIGTMNTADRSVGHIDYAIKRRFAFVDVLPNAEVIINEKAKALFNKISELFTDDHLASDFDAKDVHLGHSYFLLEENSELTESEQLQLKLDYEILPILNEYVKDGLLLETAKDKIKEISEFEC